MIAGFFQMSKRGPYSWGGFDEQPGCNCGEKITTEYTENTEGDRTTKYTNDTKHVLVKQMLHRHG